MLNTFSLNFYKLNLFLINAMRSTGADTGRIRYTIEELKKSRADIQAQIDMLDALEKETEEHERRRIRGSKRSGRSSVKSSSRSHSEANQ